MGLLLISFIAGALTVLAPCILPLLPVVLGRSAVGARKSTPYVVIGSLALSIVLFTFLLKVSTAFIAIPEGVWNAFSGGILVAFGLTFVVPALWVHMPGLQKTQVGANKVLGSGMRKKSLLGDALIGVSLGPIFSSCSPTYFVILATVLPADLVLGTVYLLAYVTGLSAVLLLIVLFGSRVTTVLMGRVIAHAWVGKTIGVVFIVLGILILTGYVKQLETALVERGWYGGADIEQQLLEANMKESEGVLSPPTGMSTPRTVFANEMHDRTAPEIVAPSGYLNTGGAPITLESLRGKVVILDFMTYSCNNCRAVIPHLSEWAELYRDQGLVVVGIHTPEFAFEREMDNVEKALASLGVSFPVVLDNDYGTWRAYNNHYWPHLFLIDREGNIVYDHIGEGAYEETESYIQKLLNE